MVYRYIAQPFCHRNTKRSSTKWIINELPKTFNDQVYPRLPFIIRSKRAKIRVPVSANLENNPATQLASQARSVTMLFRDERVILSHNRASEIRPHVERLIVEAMRHGDRHRPTMALANFWLLDKSLIHKLFKDLVPRYLNYSSAFTAIHKLGFDYSMYDRTITEVRMNRKWKIHRKGDSILELRGNNLAPVIRPTLNKSGLLTNILLAECSREKLAEENKNAP